MPESLCDFIERQRRISRISFNGHPDKATIVEWVRISTDEMVAHLADVLGVEEKAVQDALCLVVLREVDKREVA